MSQKGLYIRSFSHLGDDRVARRPRVVERAARGVEPRVLRRLLRERARVRGGELRRAGRVALVRATAISLSAAGRRSVRDTSPLDRLPAAGAAPVRQFLSVLQGEDPYATRHRSIYVTCCWSSRCLTVPLSGEGSRSVRDMSPLDRSPAAGAAAVRARRRPSRSTRRPRRAPSTTRRHRRLPRRPRPRAGGRVRSRCGARRARRR